MKNSKALLEHMRCRLPMLTSISFENITSDKKILLDVSLYDNCLQQVK